MKCKELIVVKLGTTSLIDETGVLSQERFDSFARQANALRANRYHIAFISSAAISAGAVEAGISRQQLADDLDYLSMLAAIGEPIKMAYWRSAFNRKAIVSQHLVTHHELTNDSQESQSFYKKLARTIQEGYIPIINENDALADDEIKVGDNDVISALVASGLAALRIWQVVHLVNLTDVDGYLDGMVDDPASKVVRRIENIKTVESFGVGSQSQHGTGGARTKLIAARIMVQAGHPMYIANSREPNAIARAINLQIGSHFVPQMR